MCVFLLHADLSLYHNVLKDLEEEAAAKKEGEEEEEEEGEGEEAGEEAETTTDGPENVSIRYIFLQVAAKIC